MDKGKKIYFIALVIIVFLLSTVCFSYAFFTSLNEKHGKLNIVAGTLDYKIESDDLVDNKIIVLANEIEKVELNINSLNNISSKYELYYNADNTDLEIGYSNKTKDSVFGEIDANSKKEITLIIKNNSESDKTISFGVQGGLINNDLTLTKGISLDKEITLCNYEVGEIFTFDYTGDSEVFTTLCEGKYKVELWGASGGTYNENYTGGAGAYVSGTINISKPENLYVYVGGENECVEGTEGYTQLGYNGGGKAGSNDIWETRYFCGGGGATDIRLTKGNWNDFDSLKSRIIVAAGGGGATYFTDYTFTGIGGAGGGLIGETGTGLNQGNIVYGYGGTQTSILFGYGASLTTSGGGGGYYGGNADNWSGGGGGSSFISGHDGCDAIEESSTEDNIIHTGQSIHYSNYSFTDTVMIDGLGYNWITEKGEYIGMPTYNSSSTMIGNSGNGYAKITYLGE